MLNEQLQKEINQEANDYANTEVCDWGKIQGNNQLDKWEIAHDAYRDTAMKYAEKWQQAQQLVERYEKALKEIETIIEQAINEAIFVDEWAISLVIKKALTPKTGSDE